MNTLKYQTLCDSSVIIPEESLKINISNKINNINLNNRLIRKCKNLKEIDETYLITEKIKNSKKFLLFLTSIDNKKYTVFIDIQDIRDYKYYLLNLRFDSKLYFKMGSLFSGDLTYNDKNCWIFLIDDIHFHCNKNISKIPFGAKIDVISNILKSSYQYDDFMNPFYIQLKSFYLFNHLDTITEDKTLLFYPDNPHKDILILNIIMEEEEKYDNHKVQEYNIIKDDDLPDIYKIYDFDNNFQDILTVKKLSESKYLKELFKDNKHLKLKCYRINNDWYLSK